MYSNIRCQYCQEFELDGQTSLPFGNLGVNGTLSSGDAFDCDVNGDGVYDALKERFYYISDLESNSDYAVFIYYSNTYKNTSNNKLETTVTVNSAYHFDNVNNLGPVTAVNNLPTITDWSNVSLSNTNRQIINENKDISNLYDYTGYAARLLTYQEVELVCGDGNVTSSGYLNN